MLVTELRDQRTKLCSLSKWDLIAIFRWSTLLHLDDLFTQLFHLRHTLIVVYCIDSSISLGLHRGSNCLLDKASHHGHVLLKHGDLLLLRTCSFLSFVFCLRQHCSDVQVREFFALRRHCKQHLVAGGDSFNQIWKLLVNVPFAWIHLKVVQSFHWFRAWRENFWGFTAEDRRPALSFDRWFTKSVDFFQLVLVNGIGRNIYFLSLLQLILLTLKRCSDLL